MAHLLTSLNTTRDVGDGHRLARRFGWLTPVLMLSCATTTPEADALEAILGATDHHIEQHPNRDCRVNWRPDALSVANSDARGSADAIARSAKAYEGTPYVYGGVEKGGLDCSAFVNRVYAEYGYDLPRTSREQFKVGLDVKQRDLQAGDLVFFRKRPAAGAINHVGLYLGDGRMIHASSGRHEVTTVSLEGRYYRERYAGARRLVVLPPGRYSSAAGAARRGMHFSEEKDALAYFGVHGPPCGEVEYAPLVSEASR